MRPRTFSALLLDMDGTLVDSEPRHIEAHREFLSGKGLTFTHEDIVGNVGKSDQLFFEGIAARHGMKVDVMPWVEEKDRILMLNYARDGIEKRPGVDAFLRHAWSEGLCCCVVTSSRRQVAQVSLDAAGLGARLPSRICFEDTAKHKPDPSPYLLAAQRLSVPIRNCLVIEDSVSGVLAAATAGATVIGSVSLIPADLLLAAGAVRCINDMTELIPLTERFQRAAS
jgi:HAD superfamily hydrolase (TIGR01509 family)